MTLLVCAGTICPEPARGQAVAPATGVPLGNDIGDTTPGIASDGSSYVLVWEEAGVIKAAAASPAGAVSSAVTIGSGRNPTLAGGGAGFLVVWSSGTGASAVIEAARVTVAADAVTGLAPFAVASGFDADFPAVAANGAEFLVVWQQKKDATAADNDLAFVIVSSGGVGAPLPLTADSTDEQHPSVTALDSRYLVAWQQLGLDWDIYAAVADPLGDLPLTGGTAISTAVGDQVRPAVAANVGEAFVTWADGANAPRWDIVGRAVADNAGVAIAVEGVVAVAPALTVSSAEATHALTANGVDYLAAYESGGIAYAVRVSPAGAAAGFVVAASAVEPGQGVAFSGAGYVEVHRSGAPAEISATVIDPEPQLTVSCSGPGTVTSPPPGATCGSTVTVTFGAALTLTAAAGANATFDGWTGCPAPAGASCTVTITGPTTVTASFALALPGPPGIPTYSATTSTSTVVAWSAATGATGYEVERAADDAGSPGNWGAAVVTTALSLAVDGLSPGTTYWFRVRATNDAGPGEYSSPSSMTPLTSAPSALIFSAIGQTVLTVSWTAPPGMAASYVVARSEASTGPFVDVGTSPATSFTDTSVQPATTYWYVVRGVNVEGAAGVGSAAAATTTLPYAPIAAPVVTVGAVTNATVALAWNTVDGATEYRVERALSTAPSIRTTLDGAVAATSFTDATAAANTAYLYVVSALNAGGAGPESAPVRAMTLPNAASAPAVTAGIAAVTISWIAPAGDAAAYDVERSTSSSGPFSAPAADATGVVGASYVDVTATGGTLYWYRVVARNSDGLRGEPSPATSVTTAPGQPGAPTYSDLGATTLTISWTAAAGANTYELSRAAGASTTWTIVGGGAFPASELSYADSGLLGNTTYRYRVRANGIAGFGPYSGESSVLTAPAAPAAVQFPVVTFDSVSISWTAPVTGAATYVVQRSVTGADPWTPVGGPVAGTSAADTGLAASTQYWYRVIAQNASGDSAPAVSSVYTKPQTPNAPTLTDATASSVIVGWNATDGATSYMVQRSADNASWATVATTASTTVTDPSISPGNSTYWYRVCAVGPGGNGAFSAVSSVLLRPGAPGTPTFTAIGSTSVTVSWTPPSGTATVTYELQSAPDAAGAPGPWSAPVPLTVSSMTAGSLPEGSTVWYRVRALNSAGTSAYSPQASVLLLPGMPGTPALSNVSATSVTVSWAAAAGAVSYKVERRAGNNAWAQIATGVRTTSYVDLSVIGNTQYAYRVRGTNATGDGAYSAASSTVLTPPSAPRVPTPQYTSITQTSLVVNWAAPAGGAASYEVERADDANGAPGAFVSLSNNLTAMSFADSGLTAATRYWYRVWSRNAAGEASTPATFATTLADVPIGAPGVPTYSYVYATSMQVRWTAALGATSYQVERAPDVGGVPGVWAVVRDLIPTAYTQVGVTANTRYWYRVRGVSTGGKGPYSPESSVVTAPASPGAPTFANVTSSTVHVSWVAPPGAAASYKLERALAAFGPWTMVAVGIPTAGYDDSGLRPNTPYYYRVRATNADGYDSAYSGVGSVTTPPDPSVSAPEAPLALAFVPRTTSLQVSWASVAGAASYRIERAADASGSPGAWVVVAPASSSTTYVNYGLAPNTRYWYRVAASNDGGNGPYSPAAATMTVPNAPGKPTFSSIASSAATVSWTSPVGSASTYRLERASSALGPWQTVATVATLNHRDGALAPNTSYYYRVCGVNALGGVGPYSAAGLVTTAPDSSVAAPAAPPGLTVFTLSSYSLRVSWTAAAGATSYTIERAADVQGIPGTWSQIATGVTATSLTSSGLAGNAGYWFRVRGVNAGGLGAASPAARGVTLPAPPGAPTFSNVTSTSAAISWTAPAGGAASYRIERARSWSGAWSEIGTAPTTAFVDAGLTGYSTYYYRVRAVGYTGSIGGYSATRSVVTAPDANVPPPAQPAAPQITGFASTYVRIAWPPADGAMSYIVQRSADGLNWTIAATALASTTWTGYSLAPNTQYFFRVAGENASGTGPYSASTSGYTLPIAPTAVVATAAGSSTVDVAWTAPSGGSHAYKVFRATSSIGPWTEVASTVSATAYSDVRLAANTYYYYRVRALNAAGAEGPLSAIAAARTLVDETVPLAATAAVPTVTSVGWSWVSLSWSAAAGALSYDIERAPDASGTPGTWSRVAAAVTATTFTDRAGVVGNTGYWFRVVSVNAAGASPASGPAAALTVPAAPGAPSFADVTAESVKLTWTEPGGGATVYAVERALGTTGTWSEVARTAAMTLTDTGLSAGLTYSYRVRGFNSAGLGGPYSAARSVATAAALVASQP